MERMGDNLMRAFQKVVASKMDGNWDRCIEQILGDYRRPTGIDGKSAFENYSESNSGFRSSHHTTDPSQSAVSSYMDSR